MEFIKDNFPNPSSNLLVSNSSFYNPTNSNNKNENNELINNKYILDPNNIKEFFNASNNNSNNNNNENNEFYDLNISINNNEKISKSNNEYSIAPSPILSLTTGIPIEKNFDSKNDPYKLSPSASNSSLPESNFLSSNTSIAKATLISSNQPKSLSVPLTSPILSSENLQEFVATDIEKLNSFSSSKTTQLNNDELNMTKELNSNKKFQFPYTPSSSLSFIEPIKDDNETNTFIDNNKTSSINDSKRLTNQPTKHLNNICNMEIYKPSTLLQLSNNKNKEEKKNEKEKLEKEGYEKEGIKI
ncbi:hypothetical protein H8356DRAFT_1088799 [Neocallimastix lanati (nom. inval.)]|uniref:Uncharacterized protein n=1 Tax=Neocallimastix californiae TaxID=1754190 RepID=A0A1Y2BW65_9FUNG|nr:hypothetical protein H8356DRAFT_1088799 [Neocallimastix sp. JGI-2020a]ORY38983.1 hypothetical protein LY90DRAFT_672529 [Neocallimastix californiae]|eukprot:ORY38983.1 hypothetical protein LY90DRAFT_672529 [Neocallimastix californiae]